MPHPFNDDRIVTIGDMAQYCLEQVRLGRGGYTLRFFVPQLAAHECGALHVVDSVENDAAKSVDLYGP